MRIAQLAPLWKSVPPHKYGGKELIVSLLTEQLVMLGHEVYLYACAGSKTKGHLRKIIDKPMFDLVGGFKFDAVQYYDFLSMKQVFDDAKARKIDIIHNHMDYQVSIFQDFFSVPMLTTLHSSLKPDCELLARASASSNYISISKAQRSLAPYLNYIDTVYHGIDTHDIPYSFRQGDYLLFLATVRKEKGIDRAIKIARRTKEKLIIAGDIRQQSDFDAIKPFIDDKQITFVGEVTSRQKQILMRDAKAYLFPIRWNEAFGLTVIEALASGTPVIAYPNGSLPELIEDGKTGFLVSSIDEAVKAVGNIGKISREYCRQKAQERFDVDTMAKNYIKIYKKLLHP